ncbi:Crp/Fnr family transcriptional regulator [Paracoccus sp. MC1862]|uniref:Crp/Fnr family transcriptional regulator n=1 Tax=Paracoccus sp. MC1862 TaxID=2760307 RepID=UPI001F1F8217|nr:Crp/Fnr family transcriptional regulator [Paracoccus sp. MC1862]
MPPDNQPLEYAAVWKMALSEYFIRYLQLRDELSARDLTKLRSIPTRTRSFDNGQTIIAAGEEPDESCLVLRGMAGRLHVLPGRAGQRVISALHIPGDFMDLHGFVLSKVEESILAFGTAEVEFVDHAHLDDVTKNHPHLTRLLWMTTAIDAAIHRQWLVAANALRSSAHLAHLLCEIYTRLAAVGAARNHRMTLPLLQRELASILGYSSIHINRAVRDLRDRKLLRWSGTEVELLDWPELVRLARFDPGYLDLERNRR